MTARTAEQDRPFGWVLLHGRPQSLHSFAASDAPLEFLKLETAVFPGDLQEVDRILEADVVERNKRFFGNPVANRRVIRQVVVKDRRDVDTVRPLRSRREAEYEVSLKPSKDATIARRVCVMHFVDDDVVESFC
jgi:hypothetical protein